MVQDVSVMLVQLDGPVSASSVLSGKQFLWQLGQCVSNSVVFTTDVCYGHVILRKEFLPSQLSL
jgi:hypothetical protein